MTRGMDERIVGTEEFAGIKTGYSKLDSLIDGLKKGQLIIMGARPAMGKTTFACSLVDNVCVNDGKRCIFCSSEESTLQILKRILKIHGNIKYNEEEEVCYEKIKQSSKSVRKARLRIDDSYIGEPIKFIEMCKEIGKKERVDLIIIDCLQLFEGPTSHLKDELRSLKELAVELDCPVLVLSHLNGSVEKRKNHVPQISDFPFPKIIEAVADEILLLYRRSYYDRKSDKNIATIYVERHGKHRRFSANIVFDPSIPKFWTD